MSDETAPDLAASGGVIALARANVVLRRPANHAATHCPASVADAIREHAGTGSEA